MSATKTPSLMELLTADITFHLKWSNNMAYVDRKGTIRCGNRLKPTANDPRYIKNARDRGIVVGMPNHLYHEERDHVSSSALKVFDSNVRKYHRCYIAREEAAEETERSEEKKIGSIAHSFLLDDAEDMQKMYAIEPDVIEGSVPVNKHKPDHREWLAKWAEAQEKAGRTIVTQAMYDKGGQLAMAASNDDLAMQLLFHEEAVKEVSLFAFDEGSGQRIKTRLDCLTRLEGTPCILDVKTSLQQNPQDFINRDVERFGYDISGAQYRKVFRSLTGVLPHFVWLVLSKDKEGDCQSFLVTLHPDDWLDAELAVEETLGRIATANLGNEYVSPYLNQVTTVKRRRRNYQS